MKVLLTADPELPVPPEHYGGIERIIDLLITGLQKRGHTVALIAHPDSTSTASSFFSWPGSRSQNQLDALRNMQSLWSGVREFQPDVLHSFSRIAYLAPLLRTSLPKVMSYQREPNFRTTRWAAKLAGSTVTFTGCSEYICCQGRPNGGRWQSIHNCIVLDKFTFQSQVSDDAPLVFLSRLERIKGVHSAIKIALKTSRRLIIAGNRVSTSAGEDYWQNEILPHLDQNRIEYIGPVDDVQKNKLLGQAAAMLVPIEWNEPFGIVFAEALACGTPVISCPTGALPEIIRHGTDGFLVTDIDSACEAVHNLNQIDRHTCRQRAEQHFSAKVIVKQYENLYRSLLSQKPKKLTVYARTT
ncbi:MAG: glycosyltransferase [Phormidesmis sp.]